MEVVQGGEISCGKGVGLSIGITVGLVAATVLSGGLAGVWYAAAFFSFQFGAPAAALNCADKM